MRSRGWFFDPCAYPYAGWGRCRRFPWLPRWWWTSMYGAITPNWNPPIPKEDEIDILENESSELEQKLKSIKKRIAELKE